MHTDLLVCVNMELGGFLYVMVVENGGEAGQGLWHRVTG